MPESFPPPGQALPSNNLPNWIQADRLKETLKKSFLPLLAVGAALLVGALLLLIFGYNPVKAYGLMLNGIFGSQRNISEVLLKATPLVFTGVAVAVAYSCGIWNIGAEGQFYLGAIFATYFGVFWGNLPAYILLPLVLIAGFVGGGLWALIPGLLKTWINTNEVVVTIMLNYIALGITSYLVTGPMKEASGYFPQTDMIADAARLPRIWLPTRLHVGVILAVLMAVIITIVIYRTPLGFGIRAAGSNRNAARYAGMPVNRTIITAMLLSGGSAGLGGAVELTGLTGRLFAHISPGYGFDGIAVSLIVNNNPLGTILSGLLFGALRAGSEVMQISAGVPAVLIQIIQGMTIAFVIAFGVYNIHQTQQQKIQKEGL